MKPPYARSTSILFQPLLLLGLLALLANAQAAPAHLTLDHPAVAPVVQAQERAKPSLMGIPGVIGTATGMNAQGQIAVKVFTEYEGVRGVPGTIRGFPVEVQVTGPIRALAINPEARYRPAPIGVSVGHYAITAGTIGCRVWRFAGDGIEYFLLSNNHVLANSNDAEFGDAVLQPGPFDGGVISLNPAVDCTIGTLADWVPLLFDNSPNLMDAAIAATDELETLPWTHEDAGAYGTPSARTATPAVDLEVQKYGRTSGLTYGTITDINFAGSVCYAYVSRGKKSFCAQSAYFEDQVVIGQPEFSYGGDSGSLIVTTVGNHPVALLFAGSDTHTIASPIDPILSRFSVNIDDGTLPTQRGSISGLVTDSDTQLSIEGATVTANGQSATTGANGAYTLANLPAGDYTVTASAFGYEDSETVSPVTVEAGEDTPHVNFALSPTVNVGLISGVVTDSATDLPIEGALVELEGTGQSTLTGTDGYTLSSVPPGDYTLIVSADGYAPETAQVSVTLGVDPPQHFSLEPAYIAPSDYALREAASHSTTLSDTLRLQEVYDKSHFGDGGSLLYITQLAFRMDRDQPLIQAAASLDQTIAQGVDLTNNANPHAFSNPKAPQATAAPEVSEIINIEVRLSTTGAAAEGGLSLTFDDNANEDLTVVFSGQLAVSTTGGGDSEDPNPFEIIVPFDAGFVYDPAAGNLLVDILTFTSGTINVDTSSATSDGASRVFAWTNSKSVADARDPGADVIKFGLSPVPPNLAPVAAFSATPTGLRVQFTDESWDQDGNITTWAWDFGDTSGESSLPDPAYEYSSSGTYTVTLTVTDDDGATATASQAVTVSEPPTTGVTLTVETWKTRGSMNALLTWHPEGTNVIIYRDGDVLSTTPTEPGTYHDYIGKGGGTFTYQVEVDGVLSNEVTVTF